MEQDEHCVSAVIMLWLISVYRFWYCATGGAQLQGFMCKLNI